MSAPRYYWPNARVVMTMLLDGYEVHPDSPPFTASSVPVSANVKRNTYHQADSVSLEFDANDFPVNPSQIRTGQFEVYIYQTTGLGDQNRARLVNRKPSIVGLFDRTNITYGHGDRTFRVDGQDFTALFTQKRWEPSRRVPSGVPLSRFLEQMIAEASPPRGGATKSAITLDYQAAADPIIGATDSRRHRKRGYKPSDKVKHYWDLMFEVVTRYGLICFVEGFSLVVTTPKTRLDSADAQARLRKLSWGQNLDTVEWERNMGKDRTPQIKVVSWDEEKQRVASGVFPPEGKQVAVGIGTKFDEVQVYTLYGVCDDATLRRAAESIYDQRARGESKVVVRTEDLADNDGADLLDLRTGDPLLISFDPYNLDEIRARGNAAARAQYMVSRGWKPNVAQAFSTNLDALIAFRKPFRVREVDIDWSLSGPGISLEVELQEYVSVVDPSKQVGGASL